MTADSHPARWRILVLLSVAELFGMSLWFTASAVAPHLQPLWGLSASEAGWLTSIVQLGFVAGTAVAALLNLADVVPDRRYFAASALLAAAANAALLIAPGYGAALLSRFLTGFFLAGVYPPAMKMVATWFRSARGLAIGGIVGALTIGKATPYLFRAFGGADWRSVVLVASGAAVASAMIVALGYREGPYRFARAQFSWGRAGAVVRQREYRLALGGYLGHCWELYGMWTWLPAFLVASAAARAAAGGRAPGAAMVDALAFGAIAIGGLGCLWGGRVADRIGRARLVNLSMLVSGACALAIGLFFGASFWLLIPLAWIWGFFIIADSAQFSALITEVTPSDAVGTALTLQTSLGFLLTMITIQLVPEIAAAQGWPWAFPLLALGPAAGIWAISRLHIRRGVPAAGDIGTARAGTRR